MSAGIEQKKVTSSSPGRWPPTLTFDINDSTGQGERRLAALLKDIGKALSEYQVFSEPSRIHRPATGKTIWLKKVYVRGNDLRKAETIIGRIVPAYCSVI